MYKRKTKLSSMGKFSNEVHCIQMICTQKEENELMAVDMIVDMYL